jgi:hypothetical protein
VCVSDAYTAATIDEGVDVTCVTVVMLASDVCVAVVVDVVAADERGHTRGRFDEVMVHIPCGVVRAMVLVVRHATMPPPSL